MKVLTAAPYTYQGVEIGFCDCDPGELVMLGPPDQCHCYRSEDEEDVEDEICECHFDREETPPFVGLMSLAGTTTARIEERRLTAKELRAAVSAGLARAGWLAPGVPLGVGRSMVDIEVARILQATATYGVGDVISSFSGVTFRVNDTNARAVTRRRY